MRQGISVGHNLEGMAASYATWRASTLGRITDALEQEIILDLSGPLSGLNVLDVGCGDGALAVEMWKRGAKVTGIDASKEMIASAKMRAQHEKADIIFKVGTAQSLPFPSEAFDCVLAITILCFASDAAPVLHEIERVLKPGGRVIIGELGKWSLWAAERRVRGWLGSQIWREARFRTPAELRSLTERAGLAVNKLKGGIYYPKSTLAAQLLGPCDKKFSRLTTIGAAFLALTATKLSGRPKYRY